MVQKRVVGSCLFGVKGTHFWGWFTGTPKESQSFAHTQIVLNFVCLRFGQPLLCLSKLNKSNNPARWYGGRFKQSFKRVSLGSLKSIPNRLCKNNLFRICYARLCFCLDFLLHVVHSSNTLSLNVYAALAVFFLLVLRGLRRPRDPHFEAPFCGCTRPLFWLMGICTNHAVLRVAFR